MGARKVGEPGQCQRLAQVLVRESCSPLARPFVLATQPLTEPARGVSFHGTVGFADRTQTEVIGPATESAVKSANDLFGIQLECLASGEGRERFAEFLHFRSCRSGS